MQGVDEQHLAHACRRFAAVANDDAGFHRRVVEEVRAKTDHGFDPVLLDHPGAHPLFFVAEQHAMWPENGAATLVAQAGQDVLLEGIVGAALRWRAEEVAAPLVRPPRRAMPLLDRVRWIGENHVELAQAVTGDVPGVSQRVAADDLEVFDAVQEEVHPGDAGSDEIALLPVELERAVFAAAALHFDQCRNEHAAGAAGGVVDRFAGLRGARSCVIRWTTVRLV